MLYDFICVILLSASVLSDNYAFSELLAKFQQNDYKLNFEHFDVLRFNPKYHKQYDVKTFKYNRTCTATNMTIINAVDFGSKLEMVIQAYKFLSNEYRVFPINFQVNFCSVLNQNVGGAQEMLFQASENYECPTKKDKVYKFSNLVVDEGKLPPFIPNGHYMVEAKFVYLNVETSFVRAYATVYRPFQYKSRN